MTGRTRETWAPAPLGDRVARADSGRSVDRGATDRSADISAAGHAVERRSGEAMMVKVRYKERDSDKSALITAVVSGDGTRAGSSICPTATSLSRRPCRCSAA